MENHLKFYRVLFVIPIFFIFFSCASIKQREYYIPDAPATNIENDDEIIRIVQISDLHSNDYGEAQKNLIDVVKNAKPDIVFLTGDIFDFEWPLEKCLGNVKALLAALKELCPFYYISGNHEYYFGHDNEYSYLIEEYGGVALENAVSKIQIKETDLVIAGVSDPISTENLKNRKKDKINSNTYRKTLQTVAEKSLAIEGDLHILLAHRPEFIDLYVESGVYDLILSGHAHGGQWRIPGGRGIYAPGQGLFPKYAGGRFDFKENNKPSVFIISRGLSYQKPLFPRFFNPVELVEISVQTEAFRE